jgi:hypothetical protein
LISAIDPDLFAWVKYS